MKKTRTAILITLVGLSLAACSAIREEVVYLPAPPSLSSTPARILTPPAPLECVTYTRKASGVSIRGNAWTWWRSAKGRYRRGSTPAVGSVLVLNRTWRLHLGHLAVVTDILSDREILVDKANWLNRGQVHLNIPVRDVSANNDWSAVRVWYTPGNSYGARTYPVQGFIYPERSMAAVHVH